MPTPLPTSVPFLYEATRYLGIEQKDFWPLLISLVTMLASFIIMFINARTLVKSHRRTMKRRAFEEFYFPLSMFFDDIASAINKEKILDDKFDLFAPVSAKALAAKKLMIDQYYSPMLEKIRNMEYRYFDKEIDKQIFEVIRHSRQVIDSFKCEGIFNTLEGSNTIKVPDFLRISDRIHAKAHQRIARKEVPVED